MHVDQEYAHALEALRSACEGAALSFAPPPPRELLPGGPAWAAGQDSPLPRAWVGESNEALLLLLLTLPLGAGGHPLPCAHYSPTTRAWAADAAAAPEARRRLGRRYASVERARDARCVGLVAGTLGSASLAPSLAALRALCAASGRACYTLLLGKPSAAKLGNFPECDAFVLPGCPAAALLDSRDFARPLLTAHEAALALGGGAWLPGEYRTDARELLAAAAAAAEVAAREAAEAEAAEGAAEEVGTQLALRGERALAGRGGGELAASAADYLASRRGFRGMPPLAPEGGDATTRALPGMSGRAAAYTREGGEGGGCGAPACCALAQVPG